MTTETAQFDADYENVPEHLRDGLRAWVEIGRPPGGFLMAVLQNDLVGAFGRADEKSTAGLKYVVMWLYNRAPSGCWGSPENVRDWLKMHEERHRMDEEAR